MTDPGHQILDPTGDQKDLSMDHDDAHAPEQPEQPWLHDLSLTLAAPTQVWSAPDGQIGQPASRGEVPLSGLAGVHHGERRVLCLLRLEVDGREPTPVAGHGVRGDTHTFVAVPRHLGDPGPDPTVRVERRRDVEPGLVRERYTISSTAAEPVACTLGLRVAADLAPMDGVKGGTGRPVVAPEGVGGHVLTWQEAGLRGVLRLPGARTTDEGDHTLATWDVVVPPGQSVSHELLLTVDDTGAAVSAPSRRAGWSPVEVESADRRLAPVLERSLDDLRLLRLTARGMDDVEEEFVAAGAPWFLTLFGRDSLWTARMLLPVTTDLAMSTLRLLAHHQGTRTDDVTAEEPGKILHEVRSAGFSLGEDDGADRHLPPVYYGTIDATPLWAMTLHDAWRWGAPADEVEQLLPALERALAWQVEHGDADGDLLLEYVDRSGHGLSNQGWKDSGDAVRRSDGSRATSPLALAEVQGYAYAAATRGADLLEAFGRPGADRWREWAEQLRAEFARRFWVEDALGAFPAIALDRDKRPVVSLTSNIGHLLGTGILDQDGVDVVARRLVGSDMLSGFGIRTLSTQAAGYSPTGYHVGSVWPHDTAICLAGLAAEQRSETAPVAEALLSALTAFDGRPPELFAGDARSTQPVPLPYPAACRPQAWSAASAVSLVGSVLGLRPDRDSLAVAPVQPWSFGATHVSGLGTRGRPVDIEVTADGAGSISAR
ncbi:glycogen debranching N-terminal domain-containing protein [Nocardioides zhouii]|uniref:Amylo-alpha-1,6-glucosidase n=1 Tax=Nocardioides zhouii TaxID=1168729 RepID=A0A4Q2SP22_9ACTN|nr:glycogen debranching N-terminal domain-containing protein [Nocardioides zhouii]RYC07382.1 amylo-alpha-1,6-glucosidase [Nocardioides zhouii]